MSPAVGYPEREKLQAEIISRLSCEFGNRVVLKGGGALRFAYGSPRKSEGLDFDVDLELSGEKLGSKVKKILRELRLDYSAPEQTGTVPEWKTEIAAGFPFKLEFSRKREIRREDVGLSVVDLAPWGVAGKAMIYHYVLPVLFKQKIQAVLSPNRPVPRDAFDLFVIISRAQKSGSVLSLPEGITADDIARRLAGIGEERVREELYPLLADGCGGLDYAKIVVDLYEHLKNFEVPPRNRSMSRIRKAPRL